MKFKLFFAFILLFNLLSCFEKEKKQVNTATDVSRDFIRATLDGNFKDAEALLLQDSQNTPLFESYKNYYTKLSDDKKAGYKKADIIINTYDNLNDSTAIIDYSNSYMHQPQKIKVIRKGNVWAVDFKFTSGDTSIAN
jgi:regulation of enolase protein 1 (concanavalin A-like superfamily)